MENMTYKRIYESEECLSPLGSIHHRALFGGYSLSIDDTVFAMVARGELYLRVCEPEVGYEVVPHRLLTLSKRGRPVSLNYYLVDESLWRDQSLLLQKSAQSLQVARNEKLHRDRSRRMKQLPNITYQLETLLHEVGIHDPEMLRALGSATVWYRLRCVRKDLNISVLFAMEGAILGMHAAIIPEARRQYLQTWAEMLLAGKESYDE